MSDCIFCRIVRGELPSTTVYEDDSVLAFKDINPIAPVHVLVVPKKHIADVLQLGSEDTEVLGRLFSAIQQVAKEQGIQDSGFRVISNTGPNSGQIVFHLHFHVVGGKRLQAMG